MTIINEYIAVCPNCKELIVPIFGGGVGYNHITTFRGTLYSEQEYGFEQCPLCGFADEDFNGTEAYCNLEEKEYYINE